MDARSLLVAALLVAGAIALGAWSAALEPAREGHVGLVVLLGPFATQYDAANGTTLVVQECFYCAGPGYLVRGDVTAALAGAGKAYLDAPPGAWRAVNVSGPTHRTNDQPVTVAYAGPFTLTTVGLRLAPALLAPALACAGVGLALTRTRTGTATHAAAGALAGLVASAGQASLVVVLLAYAGAFLALLAAALLAIWPTTRRYALAPVLFVASLWWLLFAIGAYYPHGAEL